jgi:hypothetical protein
LITSKVIKPTFDFFGFQSIQPVKQKSKTNGKKALFVITYSKLYHGYQAWVASTVPQNHPEKLYPPFKEIATQ